MYEATFALDKSNPLVLYDCLVPKLLNFERKDPIEVEIENEELQTMIETQRDQIKALNKDLDRVRWYTMQQ